MFSSNQILEISGDLNHTDELKEAIEFALKKSDWHRCFTRKEKPAECVFQITDKGDFCIGWGDAKNGWNAFQFDYDIDIISKIAEQHLRKQSVCGFGGDGTDSHGFLMKAIGYDTDEVRDNYRGIIIITSYNCYYAK